MAQMPKSDSVVSGTLVLDTNVIGDGTLKKDALRKIRAARNLGLQICVPDVVAAELSAHEGKDFKTLIESLRARGYLLSDDAPTSDEGFEESTLRTLREAGVRILSSTEGDLRDALWSQVFRRAPALPKRSSDGKDITTGAVDALVEIHALREAREHWSCLVTKDKRLADSSRKKGLLVESSLNFAIEAARSSALAPERAREILLEIFERESQIMSSVARAASLMGVASMHSLEVDSGFEATIAWWSDESLEWGVPEYFKTRIRVVSEVIEVVAQRDCGSHLLWDPLQISGLEEFVAEELSLIPEPFRPTINQRREDPLTPFWVKLESESMELFRGDESILTAYLNREPVDGYEYFVGGVSESAVELLSIELQLAQDSVRIPISWKGSLFAEVRRVMGRNQRSDDVNH